MSIFICPNCEKRSEIVDDGGSKVVSQVCPHCGQTFEIDHEANEVVES